MEENNIPTCQVRLFDDIIFYTRNFWSRRRFEGVGFTPKHSTPIYFEYKKGKLYRYVYMYNKWNFDESLYVHLQKRNMKVCTVNDDEYMIFPNEFRAKCVLSTNECLKLAKKTLFDVGYYKMIFKAALAKCVKTCITYGKKKN